MSRSNILEVALSAARKDSFHASIDTLSTYVHLTQDPEIQNILKSHENEAGNTSSKLASIAKITESLGKDTTPEAALAAIIKIIEN
jgi:hypothetical protein